MCDDDYKAKRNPVFWDSFALKENREEAWK
jgi:hypothetical protein